MQQRQKSLKKCMPNHYLWILERFAISIIIIAIFQYLNHTKSEYLAGGVWSNITKNLGSSSCSPWEGHLNFPPDSVGIYSTYLGIII